MKSSFSFIALLISICFILAGCQKAPEVSIIGLTNFEFSENGGSETITFIANRDWTVSCSESWIHVSPSSGEATKKKESVTVTVRCDANTTYDDRMATITIRAEDVSQTVTVKQPQNPGIILSTQSFDFATPEARTIEVEVKANVEYKVDISGSWIRQTGTKALSSKTLIFSIAENTTYDAREGKITIKSMDGSIEDQVITVRQAQKDGLIVKNSSYSVPYGGGEIEVKVEANVDFDVKINAEWLHYVSTKALSTSTVRLKAGENKTDDPRNANVEIKQKNGSLSCTVTVNQAAIPVPKGAVDLGIEMTRNDGSKYRLFWRDSNLGANKPEGYGDYYAWGEVESKSSYDWETYEWAYGTSNKSIKYCPTDKPDYWDGSGSPDGKTVLDPEDDVAHVMLGGKWRMPTKEEQDALLTQCTWTWTTLNGITGYEVKSKVNSNSIFLPAAGGRSGTYLFSAGSYGVYWSSSLYTNYPDDAWGVSFGSGSAYGDGRDRSVGRSVRPVTE